MRGTRDLLALCLAGALAVISSSGTTAAETGGGPVDVSVIDDASDIDRLHPEWVETARALGAPVGPASEASGELFQYPLRMTKRAGGFAETFIANFVDHDTGPGLEDFACGTRTYDGHGGTDIVLYPYRWSVMDNREMAVVAAMGGTIVSTNDGEVDRNCRIGGATANYVIISHDNGLFGIYWHLKKGTVIKRSPGDRVEAGTVLGYVGSSGSSTAPHLHFEARDSGNVTVDPWEGQCNARPTDWAHQSPTVDTRIIRLATHAKQPPPPSSGCDSPEPGYKDSFKPGDPLWAAVYLRDQTPGATIAFEVLRPDGAQAASWTTPSPSSGIYVASYYWGSYVLPSDAPGGEWTVRARLGGQTYAHTFKVGGNLRKARIKAEITSRNTRKVRAGKRAKFYAEIQNRSGKPAVGCRVSPGRPIDAKFEFREINPKSKRPIGKVGDNLTIPAKKAGHVRVRFKFGKDFEATSAEIPLQFDCTNTKAARYKAGRTSVVLTSR